MKYIAELHTEDYAHEGLDMPEFDKLVLDFDEDQMKALYKGSKLMLEFKHLSRVSTDYEPVVSALLNDKPVDHTGTQFEEALHYCMVTVDGAGNVCINFECKHSGGRSFVNSFNLIHDANQITGGVLYD